MNYPPNDDNQSQFPPPQQPNTSNPPQQPDTSYPYEPLQAPIPTIPPKKKTNGWHVLLVLTAAVGALLFCVMIGGIISAQSSTLASSPDATATADAANVGVTTDTPALTPTPVPTAQPTEQPTFPPQQWAFTGNGNQKTTGFAPLLDTWQLSWACDPTAYGFEYNLIVELYDINGNLMDTPVNVICKTGVTSGSTMEYNASGLYYLDVSSEGPWTIKIQTQ